MSHRDTIINGDGVKLGRITTHTLNLFPDDLSDLMKMRMTGNKLCKRIDHSNDRLTKLFLFHTGGYPQSTGTSHSSTFCAYSTPQLMFHPFTLLI